MEYGNSITVIFKLQPKPIHSIISAREDTSRSPNKHVLTSRIRITEGRSAEMP